MLISVIQMSIEIGKQNRLDLGINSPPPISKLYIWAEVPLPQYTIQFPSLNTPPNSTPQIYIHPSWWYSIIEPETSYTHDSINY